MQHISRSVKCLWLKYSFLSYRNIQPPPPPNSSLKINERGKEREMEKNENHLSKFCPFYTPWSSPDWICPPPQLDFWMRSCRKYYYLHPTRFVLFCQQYQFYTFFVAIKVSFTLYSFLKKKSSFNDRA